MVVCHCHGVNDNRIRHEIDDGAADLDQLSNRCGAGNACGGCVPALERLLDQKGPTGAFTTS